MIMAGLAQAEREIFCEKKAGYKFFGLDRRDGVVQGKKWNYDDGTTFFQHTQMNPGSIDLWHVCRHDEMECDFYRKWSGQPVCYKGRMPKTAYYWEDDSVYYMDQMSSEEIMIDGRACTKLREPRVVTPPGEVQDDTSLSTTYYCVNREFCEYGLSEVSTQFDGVVEKYRVETWNMSRDFADADVMPPEDCLNAVSHSPVDGKEYWHGEEGSYNE